MLLVYYEDDNAVLLLDFLYVKISVAGSVCEKI